MRINIIIISEVLEHMFYSMKMANISPFRCPKILFGPFRWHKSFSVFSRTGNYITVEINLLKYTHTFVEMVIKKILLIKISNSPPSSDPHLVLPVLTYSTRGNVLPFIKAKIAEFY